MTTVVDFLTARIAGDEATAEAAQGADWIEGYERAGEPGRYRGIKAHLVALPPEESVHSQSWDVGTTVAALANAADARHVARWSPSRVLAECAAKRAIIETIRTLDAGTARLSPPYVAALRCQLMMTVIMPLASVYADHPDFDPAWTVA